MSSHPIPSALGFRDVIPRVGVENWNQRSQAALCLIIGGGIMKIEAGYDIAFHFPQETAMVLMLSVHPERRHDLLTAHSIKFSPES
jgi:hypothetical protein